MASRGRTPVDDYRSRSRTRSPPPRSNYSRSPTPLARREDRSASRPRDSSRRNGKYRDSRSPSRDRDHEARGRSRTRSPSPSETAVQSTKIVVERLTKNVNEDHLWEIFGHYGHIRDLDLPLNRQFNTNRGTAYILYANEADAESAIAHMHEGQIDGAVINVSVVLPRSRFSPAPPIARRGANFDPRNPPPFRSGEGFGREGGRHRRSPPGTLHGGSGRFGKRSDTYRPRSTSRSRSRSPGDEGRSRYRSRSPYSNRSRSRSPPPRKRGGGRRESEAFEEKRRSPSRVSYSSYGRQSRSRSRSRGRARAERVHR